MAHIIAHRGASAEAPENTLHTIQLAIDHQADYIECDVRLSLDNVPVIIHDSYIHRTTNAPEHLKIEDLTLEAIKQLDAGSWYHERFSGEKIPTLDEVLSLKRKGTGLMLELKEGNSQAKVLVQAVLKSLHAASIGADTDRIIVGSFSTDIMREMQKQAPLFPLVGIVDNATNLSAFLNMNIDHLAMWHEMINHELVEELHTKKTKIWAFTVDDLQIAEALHLMKTDGIITNDPAKLKNAALF